MMQNVFLNHVLSNYFLDFDFEFITSKSGANNQLHQIKVNDQLYMLRIYTNFNELQKLQYEHEILDQLKTFNLTFTVPAPIKTKNNSSFVSIEGSILALFPYIEGIEASRGSINFYELGRVVGELTVALGNCKTPIIPPFLPTYRLLDIYPNLTEKNLNAFFDTHNLNQETISYFQTELEGLKERIPDLIGKLPNQIIHGDLMLSNILIHREKIAGILDFEFVSSDFRMSELAITISQFIRNTANDDQLLKDVNDLVKGYRQFIAVTNDEINALPDLIKIRMTTLVLHFLSRYFNNLNDLKIVENQLIRFNYVVKWVDKNRAQLLGLFK
jgi:homoserine kinase type II